MEEATVTITDDVREVLMNAKFEGERMAFTGPQLPRKLYTDCMKVIKHIGGKWQRSAKAIVFTGKDAQTVILEALGVGHVVDKKKTFHLFETPELIVDLMLSAVSIQPGARVLEPSAGRAAIANKLLPLVSYPDHLDVCEIQPDLAEDLRRAGFTVVCEDFLQLQPIHRYDFIIANPPFNAQVEHINHMLDLLAIGGTLVTIATSNLLTKEQKKYVALQERLAGMNYDIEPINSGAFKESGTLVPTIKLVVRK